MSFKIAFPTFPCLFLFSIYKIQFSKIFQWLWSRSSGPNNLKKTGLWSWSPCVKLQLWFLPLGWVVIMPHQEAHTETPVWPQGAIWLPDWLKLEEPGAGVQVECVHSVSSKPERMVGGVPQQYCTEVLVSILVVHSITVFKHTRPGRK
jgi:hypothetical protein